LTGACDCLSHARRKHVPWCPKRVSKLHSREASGSHKAFCINAINWIYKCFLKSAADMRSLLITLSLASVLAPVRGTTLERLPLDVMTEKSTAIVRARVVGSSGVLRGADVYTVYQIQIVESWKSSSGKSSPVQVAVPGGVAGGLRQMVAGAPSLYAGEEYVMFLWTGRSGLTQLIGLSQGLFKVQRSGAGDAAAMRPAAGELMLDASGHAVKDEAVSMKLSDLKAQVNRALSGEK
jgi:hypothetical protein